MNTDTSSNGHALSKYALRYGSSSDLDVDARFLKDYTKAQTGVNVFLKDGNILSLRLAIQSYRQILDYLPENHKHRRGIQWRLGTCFKLQHNSTGDLDTLTEAIFYHRASIHGLTGLHGFPLKPSIDLSSALHLRYQKLGDINDLHEAINLLLPYRAVDDELRNGVLMQLGGCLVSRNKALGSKNDLDSSVSFLREALQITPPEHHLRGKVDNNLGTALGQRYICGGWVNTSDLQEAIEMQRESVRLQAQGSHEYNDAVFNLASSLKLMFDMVGGAEYIDESIQLMQDWTNPKDNAKSDLRGSFLISTAQGIMSRSSARSPPEELDSAIACLKEALTFYPPGHTRRPRTLERLGSAFLGRSIHAGNPEDAVAGLEYMQEALDDLAPGHNRRSQLHFRLVLVYLQFGAPFYNVHTAFDHFFHGTEDGSTASIQQLNRTLPLIDILAQCSRRDKNVKSAAVRLIEAYKYAISQLPHAAYFGLDLASRLRVLVRADALAENGAIWAIELGQLDVGITMLEQGRAVFWLQYLGLRKAFNGLPEDLTSRLRNTATSLERASQQQSASDNDTKDSRAARDAMSVRLRLLSEEFEKLVMQARNYSGFEHFLLPPLFEVLARAADQSPVVILIATPFTCLAVVLLGQSQIPFHVADLKDINMGDLVSMVNKTHEGTRSGRTSMRDRATKISASKKSRGARPIEDALTYLWTNVFSLIITGLEAERATGNNRPRWTLCPTGIFTRLPIHAAGIYTDPRSSQIGLNNFVVTSYTPTLGALLSAQQTPCSRPTSKTKMILASVSQPKGGWTHLPFATQEIKEIHEVLPGNLDQCVFADSPVTGDGRSATPTTRALLEILPTASLVHLACHGHQDKNNALSSGFVLQDSMLTVAQLMSMRLHQPQLAFLSACETAKGDNAQPNQVIHLAATMMFVGFPSVIGTLWSMDDVDGPEVAVTVYKELFQPGSDTFDRSRVPYALDAAIQKLRIRGLSASRWAPYVHFGA